MRNRFDEQLVNLNNELIEMGGLIEEAIENAVVALINQDVEIAKKTINLEGEINEKEKYIESLCLKLLLQQQPVASDLRLISSALKMITDMERIGDQAEDIAELTMHLSTRPYIKKLEDIPKMAKAAVKMVNDSIDAYVHKDLNLAMSVIDYDDVMDELFDLVKEKLINAIQGNKENGEQAIDLLMVAKYFERIGDHAVNIAEWVVYSITGEHKSYE
ncbi:phosphate signaling complex protein PhoU [Alloiococcus sp. CFN-8]|uniref:phosphate signaling complex protein PhoU n=1 Tax=Alloiococcus sp. CFN-8 TaxID=3416081 RepID=UPI003CE93705